MPDVQTVHDGTDTHRVVTTDDGEHRFAVTGDESTRQGYEYEGDGDPPEAAVDALVAWINEHHDVEQGETAETAETTEGAE